MAKMMICREECKNRKDCMYAEKHEGFNGCRKTKYCPVCVPYKKTKGGMKEELACWIKTKEAKEMYGDGVIKESIKWRLKDAFTAGYKAGRKEKE
jgi:hypothetical protein